MTEYALIAGEPDKRFIIDIIDTRCTPDEVELAHPQYAVCPVGDLPDELRIRYQLWGASRR